MLCDIQSTITVYTHKYPAIALAELHTDSNTVIRKYPAIASTVNTPLYTRFTRAPTGGACRCVCDGGAVYADPNTPLDRPQVQGGQMVESGWDYGEIAVEVL